MSWRNYITRLIYKNPLSPKIKIPHLQNTILQERQKIVLHSFYQISWSLNFCTQEKIVITNTLKSSPVIFHVWEANILATNVAKQASRALLLYYNYITLQLRDFDMAINELDARKLSISRTSKMNRQKNYVKFP